MFGNSMDSNEIPREVLESNDDFSSASLGVIVANRVVCHMQAANKTGPMTLSESPLRCQVF